MQRSRRIRLPRLRGAGFPEEPETGSLTMAAIHPEIPGMPLLLQSQRSRVASSFTGNGILVRQSIRRRHHLDALNGRHAVKLRSLFGRTTGSGIKQHMKLIEALEILRKGPSQEGNKFVVSLACSYTPLHLQTLLAATIQSLDPA